MARPPKEFMDAAIPAIRASGTAEDPGAVAATQWRRMNPKAREPWEILRKMRESGVKIEPGHSPVQALVPFPPQAALPLAAAKTAVGIATGDLIVVHSTIPRGTKKNPLPPLEVEYHVNLAALGIGVAGIAVAALLGIIAWNGFSTVGGGFPGISGTNLGAWVRDHKKDRGGGSPPPRPGTPSITWCGPACAAQHLFDPWAIPACIAECLSGL